MSPQIVPSRHPAAMIAGLGRTSARVWLGALVLIASGQLPVSAQEASQPFVSAQTTVRLVSEVASVAPGQPFRLGLHERIAAGWHTYWSNPGDAGEAPELTFTLPEGATSGPLVFPAPERIEYGPLVNFGYANEVVLPVTITPPPGLRPGDRFSVKADAYWLVCADICIPEQASYTLELPVEATARPSPATHDLFTSSDAGMPRPSVWPARAGFSGNGGRLQLSGDVFTSGSVAVAFFFPATPGIIDNAAPQKLAVDDDRLTLDLTRAKGDLPRTLNGVLAITDAAGSRSSYSIEAELGPVPATSATAIPTLWQAGLLAATGGLLLNLMPCVFPILAMKAMGIAALAERGVRDIRLHALSYTGGVLVSFLALAAILLALKAGGAVAGWGFQFTSPVFVALMAWLMLGVGLNLSGVFVVNGSVDTGSGLSRRNGHVGSFATGCLAVLVATPCSAPFMAAAIGAAFLMPPLATLAVFALMGLGMALPYGLLALFPQAAGLLPRPGIWMVHLKQLLAFPMYAAAVWLVWVLSVQTGADGVALALAGAVLVAFAAWAFGLAQHTGQRTAIAAWVVGSVTLLAALALLPQLAPASGPATPAVTAGYEAWTPTRVAELQAAGRPVFVDVTAAWCITCKVNEKVALDTATTKAAFAAANVALLQADWTGGDPAITALLEEQGRQGVPLYLLYPPRSGAPAILPQVLTQSIVLDALRTLDAGVADAGTSARG